MTHLDFGDTLEIAIRDKCPFIAIHELAGIPCKPLAIGESKEI
jgi:hypothetical protein